MLNQRSWQTVRWVAGLLLTGLFLLALFGIIPQLLRIQFIPALVRAITLATVGAIAVFALLVLGTLLFGRFYCSILCPLGILQDLITKLSRGKNAKALRRETWVRYPLAGIIFGMFASGWAWGLLLLDPYSTAGRIAIGASLTGLLTLLALVALCIWRKRFFCATLCPVGVVLGLLSKWGLYRLSLSEKCVNCGKCANLCPSGCIDPGAKTVDNERCVRCMACVSQCPTGAISLQRRTPPAANPARRAFLTKGALLAAGVGTGVALTKVAKDCATAKLATPTLLLPPGAGDASRFTSKCTGCQACVAACPEKILIPTAKGLAPVALDLTLGACRYDCNACGQACPTGAILPLSLAEKQRVKMAVATFSAKKCKVFQDDEACGKCAEVCPTQAITLRKTGAPRPVKAHLCIGCGACQAVCPSKHGKAFTLEPLNPQERL